MTDKQFSFSVSVGGLLIVLGILISQQASVGITLAGLGAVILSLAVLNRKNRRNMKPISVEQ